MVFNHRNTLIYLKRIALTITGDINNLIVVWVKTERLEPKLVLEIACILLRVCHISSLCRYTDTSSSYAR
jgi:hypothetical protein